MPRDTSANWPQALDILRERGMLAHLDALAAQSLIVLKMRREDEAFFRQHLPHAANADDGASLLFEDAATVHLDCRPLSESRADGPASQYTLIRDALALFLASAKEFAPPAPFDSRGYFLFSTPRSGSTFLCDLLSGAGVLGHPTEYFKAWLKPLMQAADLGFVDLLAALRPYAGTPNGVAGAKFIIDDLFSLLPEFEQEAFAEFAQRPCYMLVRGDKAAQALSNVRANALSLYHVTDENRAEAAKTMHGFVASNAELFEKERWLLRQEADFLELARQHGLRLKLLSYEAIAQSRQAAQVAMEEVADDLGLREPVSYRAPKLVKIESLGPDSLAGYRAFRRSVVLFSARSEPNLAQVLGNGWGAVQNWGATALPERESLEFVRPPQGDFAVIEALLAFDGKPPASIVLDGGPVEIGDDDQDSYHWRLVARVGDAERLRLSLAGAVKVEEVVFYASAPEWLASILGTGRAALTPA